MLFPPSIPSTRVSEVKAWTRYLSKGAAEEGRSAHKPLIPGRSMAACDVWCAIMFLLDAVGSGRAIGVCVYHNHNKQ